MSYFFFSLYWDPRDLHLLTHSCPTRRSSYLCAYRSPRHCARSTSRPPPPWSSARRCARLAASPTRAHGPQSDDRHDKSRRHEGTRPKLVRGRSEEHTSELQSLMRTSYALLCVTKKNNTILHYRQ